MPELRQAPTWKDRRWQESVQRLTVADKFALEESLRGLLNALKDCRNPRFDAALRDWGPTRWDVPRLQATRGDWIEYRLGDDQNRGRVIVCWDSGNDVIYLVARTAIHDHTALCQMVAQFRG